MQRKGRFNIEPDIGGEAVELLTGCTLCNAQDPYIALIMQKQSHAQYTPRWELYERQRRNTETVMRWEKRHRDALLLLGR